MKKLNMTPDKMRNAQMLNNPQALDRYTMQRYGMPASEVEHTLRANAAIARGRMPEPEQMKWLISGAQKMYGWNAERVRSELNGILQLPTPEARIQGYFRAGGASISPEMLREVTGLVESYAQTEMEQSLIDRVNANPEVSHRDNRQAEMPANQRAKDFADGRTDIRNALKGQLGDSAPKTFREAQMRVKLAGLQLSNRAEAREARDMIDIANGKEPQRSLREQLSDAYDVEKVSSAMEAYGLGNVEDEATRVEQSSEHLREDFDVTEGIRDF